MITSFLARIGYAGPLNVDIETLRGIQRSEMAAVAYENVGMHLGRRYVMTENSFVAQIVEEGRGGWCYQRNGLLTTALDQIEFKVTRVGSCIKRDTLGEDGGDSTIADAGSVMTSRRNRASYPGSRANAVVFRMTRTPISVTT